MSNRIDHLGVYGLPKGKTIWAHIMEKGWGFLILVIE